jgi:hypothetical protein
MKSRIPPAANGFYIRPCTQNEEYLNVLKMGSYPFCGDCGDKEICLDGLKSLERLYKEKNEPKELN